MSDVSTSSLNTAGSSAVGSPYGFASAALNFAGDAAAAGASIYNTSTNKKISDKNYELQQGWYEYQKALQQEIFNREDTAVQRALADYTKAGFSPIAAVGHSAGAGQIVSTTAPQNPYKSELDLSSLRGAGTSLMGLMQAQSELATGQANRELTQAQAESIRLNTDIERHNYMYYSERGLPTNMTGIERMIVDILQAIGFPVKKFLDGDESVLSLAGKAKDTTASALDSAAGAVQDYIDKDAERVGRTNADFDRFRSMVKSDWWNLDHDYLRYLAKTYPGMKSYMTEYINSHAGYNIFHPRDYKARKDKYRHYSDFINQF